MKEIISEIFVYKYCSFCDKKSEEYICFECKNNFKKRCDLGIYINIKDDDFLCLSKHIYLATYPLEMKKIIEQIKYKGRMHYIKAIVSAVGKNNLEKTLSGYDIFLFTPSKFKTVIKRYGNVSKYFLDYMGKKSINIFSVSKDVELKKMNKADRIINVKEKFKINKKGAYILQKHIYQRVIETIELKKEEKKKIFLKILIVDDIYTTGTTLNYLSFILLKEINNINLYKMWKSNRKNFLKYSENEMKKKLESLQKQLRYEIDYFTIIND